MAAFCPLCLGPPPANHRPVLLPPRKTNKQIAENPHVQKVLADPRVAEAYGKLSDPAVQRHFLTDIKAVLVRLFLVFLSAARARQRGQQGGACRRCPQRPPRSLSARSPLPRRHDKHNPNNKQHGELPLKDAVADVKKVLTDAHVEEAKAAGSH